MVLVSAHRQRVDQIHQRDRLLVQLELGEPAACAVEAFFGVLDDISANNQQAAAIVADITDAGLLRGEDLIAGHAIGAIRSLAPQRHMIDPLDAIVVGEVPRRDAAMPHQHGLRFRVERGHIQQG